MLNQRFACLAYLFCISTFSIYFRLNFLELLIKGPGNGKCKFFPIKLGRQQVREICKEKIIEKFKEEKALL
jgi:hypothetical protein